MSADAASQQRQPEQPGNGAPVIPTGPSERNADSNQTMPSPGQDTLHSSGEANEGENLNSITPAKATQGGREINKKVLYVGSIDPQVTEDMLNDVFKVTGNVLSIKIFPDKNVGI